MVFVEDFYDFRIEIEVELSVDNLKSIDVDWKECTDGCPVGTESTELRSVFLWAFLEFGFVFLAREQVGGPLVLRGDGWTTVDRFFLREESYGIISVDRDVAGS